MTADPPEPPAVEEASSADPDSQKKRPRKARWGAETDAGKKVLESAAQQPEPEPAPKKRKSRWAPEPEQPAAVTSMVRAIPGLPGQIILPAAIAALVDLNPETLELQRQLNAVSVRLPFACSWR